ncbi:MAG: universal stress protein [Gemmatimonadetes bacterium]|nr:universal stress protein [Gemmatimonadota bacterium]
MIVCGTDFSPVASAAANVAAHIAHRAGALLELVNATGSPDEAASAAHAATPPAPESRAGQMAAEVSRLRALGVTVEGTLDPALPDQAMADRARRADTSLIVLGAVGLTLVERVLLGSVAERIAMASTKPVLVVRNDGPWSDWAKDARPLRVMVAFDVGASAGEALSWVAWLRQWGELRLTVCWVVNPALENQRFGATGEGAGIELLPKTRESLWREFQLLVGTQGSLPSTELRLEPTLGRVDSALTQLAGSSDQDLLVVGSHQRRGFERLWQASVSRGVLRHAPMSVAVVPHRPKGE